MFTVAAKFKRLGTRVIYLSINVQDESKKPANYQAQGRDWSVTFIREVITALREAGGVEVLDTSSYTDPLVHGNTQSRDGTHVWGFVDVMKAKAIMSALCS